MLICLNLIIIKNNKYTFNFGIKRFFSLKPVSHNLSIISIIVGAMLGGNAELEKRKSKNSKGTRVIFKQFSNNVEYLM
jgi:hypothetical protein